MQILLIVLSILAFPIAAYGTIANFTGPFFWRFVLKISAVVTAFLCVATWIILLFNVQITVQ